MWTPISPALANICGLLEHVSHTGSSGWIGRGKSQTLRGCPRRPWLQSTHPARAGGLYRCLLRYDLALVGKVFRGEGEVTRVSSRR